MSEVPLYSAQANLDRRGCSLTNLGLYIHLYMPTHHSAALISYFLRGRFPSCCISPCSRQLVVGTLPPQVPLEAS